MGKYFNVLGHFFSVYCLWKIFICTVNIVFDRVGGIDPVTKGIKIGVDWIGIDMDVRLFVICLFHLQVRFWSQHISFGLVGVIAVTSIRGLLITLTKFFLAISSSKSSNIIVLILAQIMVCSYIIYYLRLGYVLHLKRPPNANEHATGVQTYNHRSVRRAQIQFLSSMVRCNLPYFCPLQYFIPLHCS